MFLISMFLWAACAELAEVRPFLCFGWDLRRNILRLYIYYFIVGSQCIANLQIVNY